MSVAKFEPVLLQGDALEMLKSLESESVDCCVTSPPYYGLRDYGVDGQIGLEETPEEYVAKLVDVFREVRRVLGKITSTIQAITENSFWHKQFLHNNNNGDIIMENERRRRWSWH